MPEDSKHALVGQWTDLGATLALPFRCRYIFSWTELGGGQIAGYFGGYMGGGAFHDARFYARFRRGRLVEFVFSGRDWVSDEVREEPWPDAVEACADEHFQIFCEWIDFPRLDETGEQWMAPGRVDLAQKADWNGWSLGPDDLTIAPNGAKGEKAMRKVAAMAGRAGIATTWNIDPI